MLKQILIFTLLFTAAANIAATADSIEGKVLLNTAETGSLHILLTDKKTFSKPLAGIKELVIRVSSRETEAGSIEFSFTDLTPGTYGIRCFLDTDGNGELNRGLFGPAEPWGMTVKAESLRGIPKFEQISFELRGNISNMQITVE